MCVHQSPTGVSDHTLTISTMLENIVGESLNLLVLIKIIIKISMMCEATVIIVLSATAYLLH